jgi:multiple sugar transport system ATP-binding protein
MATVEIKNLCKIYGGASKVKAVDNANITINDREFVVLVGPSGCGKTTTLRMIAGLEEISDGELYIDGKLVNDVAPKDRDIAMVFQNYALYPHMSVYNNMAFGLKIRKYPKQEIDLRVKEAANILDIKELLERKPRALSGGQRQRVAVGRAIVRKPKVFLFDEPLSNLDAKLRVQMRAELSGIHTKLNATMVYVTHDQIEAMTMGDRIVVMKDGLIQQIGAPLELYNHPNNRFVAAFIGSPPMNIMRLTIKEVGGKIICDEGSFKIQLEDGKQADSLRSYVNKEVLFGIRPEDLVYTEAPAAVNNIKATVEVIEPIGSEITLYVSTKNNQPVVRVAPRYEFRIGDEINLKPDLSKLHFFDMDTEKTIGKA